MSDKLFSGKFFFGGQNHLYGIFDVLFCLFNGGSLGYCLWYLFTLTEPLTIVHFFQYNSIFHICLLMTGQKYVFFKKINSVFR